MALAAIRGDKTISELASQFGVHGNLVSQWKRRLLANVHGFLKSPHDPEGRAQQEMIDELHRKIGQLNMELDWVKKKAASSAAERRRLVDPSYKELSVCRQCELIGLPRSTWYYQPATESPENLALMRRIDEAYLAHRSSARG